VWSELRERVAPCYSQTSDMRLCGRWRVPMASQKANQGPRGLLPIGDAICRSNPIYRQGMTVAAREACILKDLLTKRTGAKDPLAGLGQAFLSAIQPLIADAWSQSAIPDFVHPHTRGEPPTDLDNSLRFGKGLLHLAGRDSAVHELMIRVRQLVEARSALGDPDLVRCVGSTRVPDGPTKSESGCITAAVT
jgi:hypothetical protein